MSACVIDNRIRTAGAQLVAAARMIREAGKLIDEAARTIREESTWRNSMHARDAARLEKIRGEVMEFQAAAVAATISVPNLPDVIGWQRSVPEDCELKEKMSA